VTVLPYPSCHDYRAPSLVPMWNLQLRGTSSGATGKDIVHHIKGQDTRSRCECEQLKWCLLLLQRLLVPVRKRFDTSEDLMEHLLECQHGLCMISRSSQVFVNFKIILSSNEISYSRIIHSSLVIAYSLRFHTILYYTIPYHFLSFLIVLSTLFCSINRFVLSVICGLRFVVV
jgi:hypothetical protein